jgi:midasin
VGRCARRRRPARRRGQRRARLRHRPPRAAGSRCQGRSAHPSSSWTIPSCQRRYLWPWRRQNEEKNARADTSQAKRKSQQKQAQQAQLQERKAARSLDIDKAVKRDQKDDDAKDDEGKAQDEVGSDDEFEFDEKAEGKGLAPTDDRLPDAEKAEDQLDDRDADEESEDGTGSDADGEEGADRRPSRRKKGDEDVDIEDDDDAPAQDDDKRRGKKGKLRLKRDAAEDEKSDEDDGDDVQDAAGDDPNDVMAAARRRWVECESHVQGLSQQLCEQLRLILEPTVADKLQGDYKTGKRINIKKIIPFIASQYKKDKIWLRRTKPNKRAYQVLIALDDSKSMAHNGADTVSLQAVALIAKALQQLDVGEFAVLKFGAQTDILHGLGDAFGVESGPNLFARLRFEQANTHMRQFLGTALDYMDTERVRAMSQVRSTTLQLLQVMFVVTDGHLTEDRAELRKLVARAEANRQVLVLIILDVKAKDDEAKPQAAGQPAIAAPPTSKAELLRRRKQEREDRMAKVQSQSVTEMQTVSFVGGKVVKKSYFDEFPFAFFLVVKQLETLPEVLADAMRQWFEVLAQGA